MSRIIQIPTLSDQPDVAVFALHSESEADESDLRARAQEDASILYARPQARRNKTRTFSEVSFKL
jgi:hypothetical protein